MRAETVRVYRWPSSSLPPRVNPAPVADPERRPAETAENGLEAGKSAAEPRTHLVARRDRVHCRTSRPARTRRRAKPLSAPPTPANARGAKLEDGLVRRRCGSWGFPQYWRPRDGLIGPEAARPPELWPAVVRPAFGRPFLRPCCGPGESFFGLKISGRRHGVRPRSTEPASPACAADGARRGPGTIFEEKRFSS